MTVYSDELYHWGIKGMKWGVRRYQNKDGTLTSEGKKHYAQDHEDYTRAHTSSSMNGLRLLPARSKKRLKLLGQPPRHLGLLRPFTTMVLL